MVKRLAFLLTLLVALPYPASATVIIVGENGNTTVYEATDYLSEKRRGNIAPQFLGQPVHWPDRRKLYEGLISAAAAKYDLSENLLHAVILQESVYDAEIVSSAGAQGLMQLMPDTAIRFGVKDAFDPAQNIDGGARYLQWLLARYKDTNLALAAYNAGEGAVDRYGGIPPYKETEDYVESITRILNVTPDGITSTSF